MTCPILHIVFRGINRQNLFEEGINIIPQRNTSFILAGGDKVMLWHDKTSLAPLCEALTVK